MNSTPPLSDNTSESSTIMQGLDPYPFATSSEKNMVCLYMYVSQAQLDSIMNDWALKLSRTLRTNDITENRLVGASNIDEAVRQRGYICFSETVKSSMMWGQYADRARGACLVFGVYLRGEQCPCSECWNRNYAHKVNRLYLTPSDRENGNANNYFHLRRVVYTQKRVEASDDKIKNMYEAMLTKSLEWEHERECRIIVPLNDIPQEDCQEEPSNVFSYKYLHRALMPALRCVVLGPRNECDVYDMEKRINNVAWKHRNDKRLDKKQKKIPHSIKVFKAVESTTDFSIEVPGFLAVPTTH